MLGRGRHLAPTATLCAGLLLAAPVLATSLPDWMRVELRARKMAITARTTLSLQRLDADAVGPILARAPELDGVAPESAEILRIDAESAALGTRSMLSLWFDPGSGQALQRERVDTVRDGRYKLLRYIQGGVYEWQRRGDPTNRDADPSTWRLKRERLVRFSGSQSDPRAVTDTLALFYLAGELRKRPSGESLRCRVYSDGGLYTVSLVSGGTEPVSVSYEWRRGGQRGSESGRPELLRVGIEAELIEADEPDAAFDLLGLEGDIRLHIDPVSGAPLQLSGRDARLGKLKIFATALELRE